MKALFAFVFVFLLLCRFSFAEIKSFTEVWNNFAYYDTNIERKGFSSLLGRYEGKFGIYLFETPFQVYGAYYGVSSQDPHHWNNVIYAGGGLRFKPFQAYEGRGWFDDWVKDLKVFTEGLYSFYLRDIASGEANRRTDLRVGFDLWHEWNLDKPDESLPWGEVWSNLSYRTTNFSWTDFNNYLFYWQPKLGWHLGRGAGVYLRADLTYSGNDSYYWLNVLDYGAGLRFAPWRNDDSIHPLFRKFQLFVEALAVSYLKNKPTNSDNEVSSDVRFGFDFSYGR